MLPFFYLLELLVFLFETCLYGFCICKLYKVIVCTSVTFILVLVLWLSIKLLRMSLKIRLRGIDLYRRIDISLSGKRLFIYCRCVLIGLLT